jgi:hypothetical protein
MGQLGRQLICQLFVIYVATDMALCATLFAPWALPRETISGLMGRWELTENGLRWRFGVVASALVDRLYFWEPDHCAEVYKCELKARAVLYPDRPGAVP